MRRLHVKVVFARIWADSMGYTGDKRIHQMWNYVDSTFVL